MHGQPAELIDGGAISMNPASSLWGRAQWMKERVLRRMMPTRMHFMTYDWQLWPEACPCDLDFCDYLRERNIRARSIFHFGSGGHHLVGVRNRDDGLGNQILAITASPREHAAYVRSIIRAPSLGMSYKVLFADIYNLSAAGLPAFDLTTLFHLGEFVEPPSPRRRLDDTGVLDLFLSKTAPGGRLFFYEGSCGRREARPIIDRAVSDGRMSFEEQYRSLLVYRATPPVAA